jgi:hypothetical protein
LVIVRGFDPPPRRELRASFDGLKNKEIMDYKDCAEQSCDESVVSNYASISYDDPQLDQTYLDDIVNSYELKAFETLLGYLIDLDLPDGTDPNSTSFVPGLKITFGDTTREYIKVSASLLNASVLGATITDINGVPTTILSSAGTLSSSATAGTGLSAGGGGAAVPVTLTTVSDRDGSCSVTQTALAGATIALGAERFKRLNKFGIEESDFIGVVDVVFSGRKVQALTVSPGSSSLGVSGLVRSTVRPNRELISLPQGKNWSYSIDPVTENVTVNLFSIIEDEFTRFVCETYRDPVGATGNTLTNLVSVTTMDLVDTETLSDFDDHICNIGDSLGYRVNTGNNGTAEICIVVERKRPSIDIFDPRGNAD